MINTKCVSLLSVSNWVTRRSKISAWARLPLFPSI